MGAQWRRRLLYGMGRNDALPKEFFGKDRKQAADAATTKMSILTAAADVAPEDSMLFSAYHEGV